MLTEAHGALLDALPVLRLATVSPRGDPFLTPVRFHFDGEFFYLAVSADGEAGTHLRANRRIALLADRGAAGRLEGFVVQGLANPVRSRTETEEVREAMEARYAEGKGDEVGENLVKVTPLHVTDLPAE